MNDHVAVAAMDSSTRADSRSYLSGFGNHFASEAVPGALPVGRNSPQRTPFGLYAEQLSGTAFTAPRHENRRSWFYRLRPSANHAAFRPYTTPSRLETAPFQRPPSPNRLRWDPLPTPAQPTDWLDGLVTYGGTGSIADDVEGAIGVIRLGRPGDLDVATLLPFVQHACEAVTHL